MFGLKKPFFNKSCTLQWDNASRTIKDENRRETAFEVLRELPDDLHSIFVGLLPPANGTADSCLSGRRTLRFESALHS